MKIIRVAAIALCVALFAGCSSQPDISGGVAFESPRAGRSKAKFGEKLLDFTAPKLGGGQVVGSEFVGKDVAIWFWAPW